MLFVTQGKTNLKFIFPFALIGLFIIIVIFSIQYLFGDNWENNSEKINVFSDPGQEQVISGAKIVKTVSGREFTITPKASYAISARLVSKRDYHSGWESQISPFDLALVWGDLADIKNKKLLSYNQSNRWYFYNYSNNLFSSDYIATHSSNNHIIPANKTVEEAIKNLKTGQLIALNGYLVDVTSGDNWWNTSLTRTDDGDGSCEIIYVESLKTTKGAYK